MTLAMRCTKIREDELIADRIHKLRSDIENVGHNRNDREFVQECELRVEVLSRKLNPNQIDIHMTFHGKRLGGRLRAACVSESLWLFLHRDSPCGEQQ